MSKIIKAVDLYCGTGGSNKVYHVAIEQTDEGFNVLTKYGARGRSLTPGSKARGVSKEKAEQVFEKLLKEKLSASPAYIVKPGISGKVFDVDSDAVDVEASSVSLPEIKKHSGYTPQLLTEMEEDEIELLIEDPNFGCQEKIDGDRLGVRRRASLIEGVNKKGFIIPVAAEIATDIHSFNCDLFFDSEYMSNKLYTFGLHDFDGQDLTRTPYYKVHEMLQKILSDCSVPNLKVVPLASTSQEKRELFEKVRKENGEGVVFKLLSGCYSPGKPASGGDQRKFKFKADASVIILKVNDKRSVQMGLYDNGQLIPVGNVTIPPNSEMPVPGSICDVRYLYAFFGGSIFQPVYKGPRYDVSEDECVTSRLKYKKVEDVEDDAA